MCSCMWIERDKNAKRDRNRGIERQSLSTTSLALVRYLKNQFAKFLFRCYFRLRPKGRVSKRVANQRESNAELGLCMCGCKWVWVSVLASEKPMYIIYIYILTGSPDDIDAKESRSFHTVPLFLVNNFSNCYSKRRTPKKRE